MTALKISLNDFDIVVRAWPTFRRLHMLYRITTILDNTSVKQT